jgi:peptidyl-prolyl cis-trans isomerase C
MKTKLAYWIIVGLCCAVLACSQEETREKQVLVEINDFALTLDEFQVQLAEELEMDKDFKLTQEAKKDFLDRLIVKEVLIQEAKKRNLDSREKFIRTIERYWESTLIRDLMVIKGQEIAKRTVVSQEEIEARYKRMKELNANQPPLGSVRESISKQIMEDKKNKMLKEWVNQLKQKAKIQINQQLLSKS